MPENRAFTAHFNTSFSKIKQNASQFMASQTNEPLPDGYQLHGYTIEKLLSSGGFSIVYLARDENATPVAIKEYLPSALVLRTGGAEVK